MKKAILFLLCLAMLVSAVACKGDSGESEDTGNTGAQKKTYTSILETYVRYLSQKAALQPLSQAEDEIDGAVRAAVESCEDTAAMGYATKDLNGDGVEELVLLDRSSWLYGLFTMKDGAPVLLMQMNRLSSVIAPDGTVYARVYVKDQSEITHVKQVVNGRLEGLEFGTVITNGKTSHYQVENGIRKELTQQELSRLSESVRSTFLSCSYTNKSAGFRFIPALGGGEDATAPVADFSSYDAILAAYRRIVESFEGYTQSKWINGEFDQLFRFSSNESYDIFHAIFYGGVRVRPTKTAFVSEYAENGNHAYGYAKKDLNGDGTEELILMNDNYRVIAMFTQVNGAPILLKGAYGTWINEAGQLRAEIGTGGAMSRDGEAFLYEIGDGALHCLLHVGYRVNITLLKNEWYRIENGARVSISKAEGEALYAQYDILPHGWTEQEYTKSFAQIVFVPLYEKTKPSESHLASFTNMAIVNGDRITVSAVSENSLSFALELVEVSNGANDPSFEPQRMTVVADAVLENGVYSFHANGVRGYIELCVGSLWVVVEESQTEWVECRSYLFDYSAV